MKIFSSLHLLAALGALGAATGASAQVDTSQWKCSVVSLPEGNHGQRRRRRRPRQRLVAEVR
jgi:hypothetical protein